MDIRRFIDNTLLKPNVTEREVEEFVRRSEGIGFFAVCVNPCHVRLAKEVISGSIKVCSVVGFPLGSTPKEVKLHEALRVARDGADEIDMVMNISAFKSGKTEHVLEEIKAVKRESAKLLKVIIETAYLSQEEKKLATEIVLEAGAEFVKTSTGFASEGAKVEDIKLLKDAGRGRLKVKASGGIRSLKEALAMIEAGADRIGTSSGFNIYKESTGG